VGDAGADAGPELELARSAVQGGDVDGAVVHLSQAIRTLSAAGERCRAAMACAELGDLYAMAQGNLTAARAWFRRARRLVAGEEPCVEQGWVAVAEMGCDVEDPRALADSADLALDLARRFDDVNLETKALADAGLARVQAGRVTEGMAMLDEAMALACGPADDDEVAGRSVCSFLTACYHAADFDRASAWADALRRRGLLGLEPGAPALVRSHCDSVHAAALCELGRWGEAEALLLRAIEEVETATRLPSWHPAIALAELRIRQGRLAEAEVLLLGKDGHVQALLPAARLHLARGDHDLARATAVRGLRALAGDRLRSAELLAVLVDAELAVGDVEAAAAACTDLVARTAGLAVPGLAARVAAVRARVLEAQGEAAAAIGTVEEALELLPPAGLPLLRATLLLELVRLHHRAGNRAAAAVEASRAAAALDGLDVVAPPGTAELLGRVATGHAGGGGGGGAASRATLRREARGWVLDHAGSRARVGDTKGLRYLADLVADPGVERHALDLVDRVEGVAPAGEGLDRRRLGDAGALSDARARAAYRHRIEALRSEVDDALASGADGRAEALEAELDGLVTELTRAFGLGGRDRRASSAAERARLNVTRALRAATARITALLPEAGLALDASLRTGLYCAYEPGEDPGVRWSFIPD